MEQITINATINSSIENVWKFFTEPEHIKQWNTASEDWHTTAAKNDLREGGRFCYRMEAKDGSFGFDFSGSYEKVKHYDHIIYKLDDDRRVNITFHKLGGDVTQVVEVFDAENENSIEMQRTGWQAILDNFKNYAQFS